MLRNTSLITILSTTIAASGLVFGASQAQAITFSGSSSGEWGLPGGSIGPDVVLSDENGGTNNRLTWGSPIIGSFSNYVQYDGMNFSTEVDELFAISELTYRNGTTSLSSGFDGDFPLEVKLSFTSPLSSTETFDYTFNIINTPNNTGDPVLDGDKLSFAATGSTEDSFSFGGTDYTLELLGFSNDGGSTILNEFNSPEETTAEALLYARITAVESEDVPEPTAILGLGLFGAVLAGSRRKSK